MGFLCGNYLLWKNNIMKIFFLINEKGYLDKSEFDHLLASIGIKNDRTLNDRLFWLFDMHGNNVI